MSFESVPEAPSPFTAVAEHFDKHQQTLAPRDSSVEYRDFVQTLPSYKPPPNRHAGTIFSIPRSARNKIYRLCLTIPYVSSNIYITARQPKDPLRPGPSIKLSLFLVSRKVSQEASELFYAENAFRFAIPTQDLHPYAFHPSLWRIRKCWLDINYPSASQTDTWIDCVKKRSRLESLINAFTNQLVLRVDHLMRWLQIVNERPDHDLNVQWHELLAPLAKIRNIKKVYISGRLGNTCRDYLEDVMSRNEGMEYIKLEDWIGQTEEWRALKYVKEKGSHIASRRIDLFREVFPDLEPTPKMIEEGKKKEEAERKAREAKEKREAAELSAREKREKDRLRVRGKPRKMGGSSVGTVTPTTSRTGTPTATPTPKGELGFGGEAFVAE